MFKKINIILTKNEKIKLILFSLGGLLSSILEIIGIGTVGPILLAILNPSFLINKINQFDQLIFLQNIEIEKLMLLSFLIFFISFTFKSLFTFYISTRIIKIGTEIQKNLREKFIRNFLKLNYENVTKIKSSEIFHYIGHITRTFCQNTLVKIFLLISDFIVFVSIILLMLITNFKLFLLIFIILMMCYLFYYFFIRNKIEKFGRLFGKSDQSFIDISKSIVNGYKTIKILNEDKIFLDLFKKNNLVSTHAEYNYTKILLLPKVILEISFILIIASIFSLSILFDGSLNPDRTALLGIFAIASARAIPLIYNIFNSIGNIMGSKYSVEKIHKEVINNTEFLNQNLTDQKNEINFEFASLDFKNVSFNYYQNDDVISNFDLSIKKNEFVAIVGPSGSGKTTIIDIICGFLSPNDGKVLINNKINLKDTLYNWRKKISYTPQQNFIFNGSVLENITFSKELNNDELIKFNKVIEQTRLKNFLDQKNENYNFIVMEEGKNLSGGQAQRIALARALYFNKEIIIFDESLNSLNEELQKEIINECKNISKKITLILITHNKSILKHFDKVIELI